jgi:hypothetical protein
MKLTLRERRSSLATISLARTLLHIASADARRLAAQGPRRDTRNLQGRKAVTDITGALPVSRPVTTHGSPYTGLTHACHAVS